LPLTERLQIKIVPDTRVRNSPRSLEEE